MRMLKLIFSLLVAAMLAWPGMLVQAQDDPYASAIRAFGAKYGARDALIRPEQPYYYLGFSPDQACPGYSASITISKADDTMNFLYTGHGPDSTAEWIDFHGRQGLYYTWNKEKDSPSIAQRVERVYWISDDGSKLFEVQTIYPVSQKLPCMDAPENHVRIFADEFYCTLVGHNGISDTTGFCSPTQAATETPAGAITLEGQVTDGHGLPLPYLSLRLIYGGYEQSVRTDANGNYRFANLPASPDLQFNPLEDLYELEIRLDYQEPGKASPLFGIHYQSENTPVLTVRTLPFAMTGSQALVKKDIHFSSLADLDTEGMSSLEARLPERLDDLAAIYAHHAEAVQLANLLGAPLDLPIKIVPYYPGKNGAFWRGEGSSSATSTQVAIIGYGENDGASDYNDFDRPMNREWHEFGHHVMADVYGDKLPRASNRVNHGGLCKNDYSTDAWSEGFAEFYSMMVAKHVGGMPNYSHYQWGTSSVSNLEINWMTFHDPDEEFAVAGLLLDLVDGAADYPGGKDDDLIQVDISTLWNVFAQGASIEGQSNGHIFSIYDLYTNLAYQGIGAGDSDQNGLSDLDDLFISHGYFEDLNGDWTYQNGETIGQSGHSAYTYYYQDQSGNLITCPARTTRRDKEDYPGAYVDFKILDQGGQAVDQAYFHVEIVLAPPYEALSYAYDVPREVLANHRLYLALPPAEYPSQAVVTAKGTGYGDSEPLRIDSVDFWKHLPAGVDDPLLQHEFVLSQNSNLIWVVLLGGGLCISLILLVVGITRKDRLARRLPLILISLLVCVALAIVLVHLITTQGGIGAPNLGIKQNPGNASAIPESPAVSPQTQASKTAPAAPTITPPSIPTAPAATQTSTILSPSAFNFAVCGAPCAGDLSNQQTSFPEKTERLYLHFDYQAIPPGADYVRVWKNRGEEWVRYVCPWDGAESGSFNAEMREPTGFRSGEWTVEVYVRGELIGQHRFTILGGHDYWDPVGIVQGCR